VLNRVLHPKDLTSHKKRFYYLGYVVHNADELEKIMAVGNKNRHIGATAMNTESSRSHAIFSITVESSKKGADGKVHVKMGKLHLVDLAVRVIVACAFLCVCAVWFFSYCFFFRGRLRKSLSVPVEPVH
jgi:hypothetical protein